MAQHAITDPVEKVVAEALRGLPYTLEGEKGQRIDFMINDVAIECKRMHAERVIKQMEQHENYILVCGMEAANLLLRLTNQSEEER